MPAHRKTHAPARSVLAEHVRRLLNERPANVSVESIAIACDLSHPTVSDHMTGRRYIANVHSLERLYVFLAKRDLIIL